MLYWLATIVIAGFIVVLSNQMPALQKALEGTVNNYNENFGDIELANAVS